MRPKEIRRYAVKLELGQHYTLWFFGRPLVVRFIQPTRKGFNFLDVRTSKCILTHHLYVQRGTENTFWVGNYILTIRKHELTTEGCAG